ncbi:MAG TPA: hypothetical protein VFV67_13005 [Actinophytocola sp.]|uniref:hypothetical protein n=1 Tax=Actinophytocola sp. TaxID=1872138 RepID=UPI002DB8D4BD|nr:hypothetical protein [Actinophytocola sp.]HEU5471565.1 hypothetical protein [Actinophytocola sp.]
MTRLIRERRLQQVAGAESDGTVWVRRAARTATAARAVADIDPDSAFVLTYDAARQACTALLVHQGLRPTTEGGHYVIEEVLRAQFGDLLRRFSVLRRRRNELEYLTLSGDRADIDEVTTALDDIEQIIQAVERLLPNLSRF